MPFVQFLPERVLKALNRRFSMGFRAKGEWYETTLLTASDLRRLFPDGEIHRERMFGVTKSLMAVRPARPAGGHSTEARRRATARPPEAERPAVTDGSDSPRISRSLRPHPEPGGIDVCGLL